jgi:hypothetical protein
MKLYVWILIMLGLLTVVTAAFALAPHKRSLLDCGNRITVLRGNDGAAMLCVCLGGVLASCFEPGP